VDQRTYERQRDLLREKLAVGELRLEDAADEGLDVEGILEFANKVLTDAARLWEQASPTNKQRLQQVFFPEGVEHAATAGIRTAVTCLAFTGVRPRASGEFGLASLTVPTWNQLQDWLRSMDELRLALAEHAA
jgi:hypothetical protein